MGTNPWLSLPTELPYVLPEDQEAVEEFNRNLDDPKHAYHLHTDKLLPEPFVGAKDAPVLLLSNNPGYSPDPEKLRHRQTERFRNVMRNNLHHAVPDYPFVYLNPAFDEWEAWWRPKVQPLIERFDQKTVARSILNVVYFPYPSRKFGHRRCRVPSQAYSFDLVRDAVDRKAVVILLRSGKGNQKAWLNAVRELNGYDRFYLGSNPQRPHVSPGNCPTFFDKVVTAIDSFINSRAATA